MSAATIPTTVTGNYVIDPTHTRIGLVARHAMVTKVRGSFTDFIHFPTWFLSLIGDKGTYQEQKFDEDAEKARRSDG